MSHYVFQVMKLSYGLSHDGLLERIWVTLAGEFFIRAYDKYAKKQSYKVLTIF